MQSGLVVRPDDLTQLQLDGQFPLIHSEYGQAEDDQGDAERHDAAESKITH